MSLIKLMKLMTGDDEKYFKLNYLKNSRNPHLS